MKKVVFLFSLLLLFSALVGCSKQESANTPVNDKRDKGTVQQVENTPKESVTPEKPEKPKVLQEYDFQPNVDPSTISQETKDKLQELVNKLGDPTPGQIDFVGFDPYFKEGKLYVNLIVRNGTDKTIYDLSARIRIKKGEEIIASGNFFFSKEGFGVLEPGMSRVMTIFYIGDEIKNNNADLSKFSVESYYRYNSY